MADRTTYDIDIRYQLTDKGLSSSLTGVEKKAMAAEKALAGVEKAIGAIQKVGVAEKVGGGIQKAIGERGVYALKLADEAAKGVHKRFDGLKAGIREVDDAARSTTGSMGLLGGAIGSVGLAIGAAGVFAAGKRALIDFNAEVEQSKIAIAANEVLFHKELPFSVAMERAQGTFERYQETAKAAVGETKDYLAMHLALAPAMAKSGAAQRQFEQIVKGAVVASPVFGERADVIALDIKQMLLGTVSARDRVASTLIASMGYAVDEFNKKAKSDPKFALEFVHKALNQKAITDAAEAFGESFAGVTSTLKDTVEILAGTAGKGLFAEITKEIKSANDYLDRNSGKLEEMGREFGRTLVDGFHAVRDAVGFLVDHKEELLDVARVWLAIKGINVGASGVASLANMATGAAGGLGSFTAALGPATMALGGLYTSLEFISAKFDEHQKAQIASDVDVEAIRHYVASGRAGELRAVLGKMVTGESGDKLNAAAFEQFMRLNALHHYEMFDAAAAGKLAGEIQTLLAAKPRQAPILDYGPSLDQLRRHDVTQGKVKPGTQVNVTIQKIEVASDDPDRFAFDLVEGFRKAALNPTQAADAIPRGI